MPKVSNVTNSNDPQLINSRVFVGNLNTFVVTKEDVERIFKRYGRIYGISMHKGYTFVQFCNEYDARNAVAGEEGRVVAGQTLDVNMASEPKPNRPSRSGATTGGVTDWDYFYDTGYSHTARPMPGPPMKRGRSDALTVRRELVPVRQKGKAGQQSKGNTDELFVQYNVADVLICGNCKEQFDNLEDMLVHRQATCKFRFACKCQEMEEKAALEVGPFHCALCNEEFPDLYDALFHAQSNHDVKVVEEELIEKKKTEEQEENVGDGTGNHEGEASVDSHNVGESVDVNEGQGEFVNDGDEEMAVQDTEGGEEADIAE